MSSYAILILLCTFSFSSPTPAQKRYFAVKYDMRSDEDGRESQKEEEKEEPAPTQQKNGEERPGKGEKHPKESSNSAAAAAAAAAAADGSDEEGENHRKGKKGNEKKNNKDGNKDCKKGKKKKKGNKGSSSASASVAVSAATGDDGKNNKGKGDKNKGKTGKGKDKDDEKEDPGDGGKGDKGKGGKGKDKEDEKDGGKGDKGKGGKGKEGGKKGGAAAAAAAAAAASSSSEEEEDGSSEEGEDEEGDEGEGDEEKEEGEEGEGDRGKSDEEKGNKEDGKPPCPSGASSATAAATAAVAAAVAAGGGISSATASAAITSQVSFTPFKEHTCPCAPTGQYRNTAGLVYGEAGRDRERSGHKSVGNYVDLELEQYVISMISATGLRLRPANCDGTGPKESYLTAMSPPDRYNLAQPCELWVFEPFFVKGKRVYQIRNVQRGLYLRASSHIYRKYYHFCSLRPRDTGDMSMYWDLTGWSIRNLLYDEYLTHSPRNETGYAMTHPITSDHMVTWVLTKKSELSKLKRASTGENNRVPEDR